MRNYSHGGTSLTQRQRLQIAWFLANTVSLAEQQFEAIRAQIPGVQSKFICGDHGVDAWSSKPGVWDAVLLNTRIVVSTYQILFDAVSHALVPLKSLGLIVVDEGVPRAVSPSPGVPLVDSLQRTTVSRRTPSRGS